MSTHNYFPCRRLKHNEISSPLKQKHTGDRYHCCNRTHVLETKLQDEFCTFKTYQGCVNKELCKRINFILELCHLVNTREVH